MPPPLHASSRDRPTGSGGSSTAPSVVVLVEGDSDAAAVRALARRCGLDLDARGARLVSAAGITNFPNLVDAARRSWPGVPVVGLYDEAEEHHVRRALASDAGDAGSVRAEGGLDRDAIEARGFFVCIADLEDELIRALGTEPVERVLASEGELRAFRTFQGQPAQRSRPLPGQLRRFMGTKSMRKIRYGALLVDALDLDRTPPPLARLMARVH